MSECAHTRESVRLVAETTLGASIKSLTLIRAIDGTVDSLAWIQRGADSDCKFFSSAAETFRNCERSDPIDPDGILQSSLVDTEEAIEKLHAQLVTKRDAARVARELGGADRTAVIDAYVSAIASVADLHSALSDCRWAIAEYDADLVVPKGPALRSAQEVSAFLDGL